MGRTHWNAIREELQLPRDGVLCLGTQIPETQPALQTLDVPAPTIA